MPITLPRWFTGRFQVTRLVLIAAGLLPSLGCINSYSETTAAPSPVASTEVAAKDKPAPSAAADSEQRQPVADAPHVLSDADLAAGWIALFDGETLFGWKAYSKANWAVKEGAITVSEGEKGLLCTHVQFSDYELRLDYQATPETNSGIFLRTPTVAELEDVTTRCYELNIAPPSNGFPTGSLVGREKAEGIVTDNAWHTLHVTVLGDKVTVKHDDKELYTYTDKMPPGRGYIGLQLNSGAIAFKNVHLKPLALAPIFNGKDLTGWSKPEGSKSEFSVSEDGLLKVKNGRGALESDGAYGDFVLQLECMTHAKELNSGIFFRSIPKELTNGYESQIHNGYKNGDRTQPVDHGTGAIFRRVNARLVVADDLAWLYKTVVADGANIEVWVNGYPVTAWTDERKADKNPRNGLRTEAGTLQIQGHDPTTDLSFRNIKIAELRK